MPDLLLCPPLREQVANYLEPRAAAIDAADEHIRDSLGFLNCEIIAAGQDGQRAHDAAGKGRHPNADLYHVAETISTAAASSMSAAFSLWCHRMVLEYLGDAPSDSYVGTSVLPSVLRNEMLGSTALAAAMAHHVSGAPLPVTWREEGGAIVLNGRITWASNLFPPEFIMVTAAAHVDDGREIVLAIPGDAPGVHIDPYPTLLALQATGSSSLSLENLRLSPQWLITDAFTPFINRVRPTFLLLQSSFCWGLAHRALVEARGALRRTDDIFTPEVTALEEQAECYAGAIHSGITNVRRYQEAGAVRDLVQIRLRCAQLTTAAVALEAK
ncbi:MAG TPA: acyl-CoA dehydrogenase family protein, partial [Chloroflexota bacterium]|nr:acyl-CoA dehydrogenase family protein [Chloroflexota bacterium]